MIPSGPDFPKAPLSLTTTDGVCFSSLLELPLASLWDYSAVQQWTTKPSSRPCPLPDLGFPRSLDMACYRCVSKDPV